MKGAGEPCFILIASRKACESVLQYFCMCYAGAIHVQRMRKHFENTAAFLRAQNW